MTATTTIGGRAWSFGDNVSTEYMMPGFTMLGKMTDDLAKHNCMAALRPEFAKDVKLGDIIVAGENFGCGSSRIASKLLLALGISCVLAESVAGIFYRNSISTGLPVIELRGISKFLRDGDQCAVRLTDGLIENRATGGTLKFPPFPAHIITLLDAGGLIPLLKAELAAAH
jgi:3-isopropylmalate/(R)-2-methylmalate dehydratase small subunit